jgi:hypothetical protein
LGITLAIVIAVSGGSSTQIKESALGASASPSASASASAPATTVTALPIAGTVNAVGDVAGTDAQDAAGNAINFNQTPAEAANTMNCTLTVPANPLTATGLATPWQLGDGCSETQNGATEGAFVEATILSPNGQTQVYNPLVINQGGQAAVAPTAPTIAQGSQVIIDVGFNGNALALTGAGAAQGNCIDALGNSLINQTPTCNAANFYNLANSEIARGVLTVPPVGMATDGKPCQTTENFALIDQDQSDNVDSAYLVNANTGQVAQDSAANAANLANNGFAALTNGSDDGLLDAFVDPALGCKPFSATDTTAANGTSGSEALNVLSARQNSVANRALDPVNDPQLLLAGKLSIQKVNVYRAQTDQAPLSTAANPEQNSATYCQNMVNIQTPRLKGDAALEMNTTSPVPAQGNNLTNFLASRENASFTNLNCQDFGLTNPVTLTLDGNMVAIGATYNTNPQTAKVPNAANGTTGTAMPPATGTGGGRPAQHMPGHRGHM